MQVPQLQRLLEPGPSPNKRRPRARQHSLPLRAGINGSKCLGLWQKLLEGNSSCQPKPTPQPWGLLSWVKELQVRTVFKAVSHDSKRPSAGCPPWELGRRGYRCWRCAGAERLCLVFIATEPLT